MKESEEKEPKAGIVILVELEEMRRDDSERLIFSHMMSGDWDAIVDKYRGEDRILKISVTGDTAMHLAARFGKREHIRKMLEKVGKDEAFEILSIQNNGGNTALHIAAELGDAAVCHCMAIKDARLLSVPNQEGATPLYVCVANGQRDTFFTLESLLKKAREAIDFTLYKQSNGYTILHTAVFREYFELAILIVNTYPDLVNFKDDSGLSPLHILATKREAFKSTSLLGFLDCIILQRINVEQPVDEKQERPATYNIEREVEILRTEPEHCGNDTRSYRANSRTALMSLPGNGNMVKHLYGILVPILYEAVAFILYISFYIIKVLLKMAGMGWLDIHHSAQYVSERSKSLREKKMRWRVASALLKRLVDRSSMYENSPNSPHPSPLDLHQTNKSEDVETERLDTPFLIAARNGVIEVAELILEKFPLAAFDLDSELKNAAMLAAENKQVSFFKFLLEKHPTETNRMLLQLEKQGNSVLHLSATFQDPSMYAPEPASLLRAQYSWFKFVETKMPVEFSHLHNRSGLTPEEVFMKTYRELIKSASEWLVKTSESCSVIAALITTVAFATSAVDPPAPGSNTRKFVGVSLFDLYSIFALLALCFSVVSLFYFLSIRTSHFKVKDFVETLPTKLFLGLLFLLLSMVCILASFCFRHHSKLNNVNEAIRPFVIPIYILSGVRVVSLAASQLPFHGALFEFKFRDQSV